MITSQVKDFIKKYNLSGTFVVAFSGGYDSMCLLDILYKSGFDIVAAHLNHNWRGNESLKEAEVCEKFCISRGIRFYTETLSDEVEKTETAAREARYDFLRRCAKKYNSNVVFTAHNFDDNAETVLYRIIKGTGFFGLQGIAEHRDIFYRPLLKTSRENIEKYCFENGLEPNNDSSNTNTKYKRNLIRHKILPLMKEINPKVIDAVNSLSEIAQNDDEQRDFVRQLLVDNKLDYNRKRIEEICDFINKNKTSKSGKTLSLTTDLWLFANCDKTEIISKKYAGNTEIQVDKEGEYIFDNYIFTLSLWEMEQLCEQSEPQVRERINYPKDSEFKAYINIDKINFTLRHRKDGDIIQPLGINGTQKFKKYLNEKKIPNHEKDSIILLCRENEVFWAAGLGLSDKIKVTDKPTHVISLRKADYEH